MKSSPKYAVKYAEKYSSHLLISTLIVSSLLMVNCNKAPSRTGVKANTVSGKTADPAKDASGDAKKEIVIAEGTQVCSAEIQNSYRKIYLDIAASMKDKKKISKEDAEKIVSNCEEYQKIFLATKLDRCSFLSADKTELYSLDKAPKKCLDIAEILKAEYNVETEYLKSASDQSEIRRQQTIKANETKALIGQKFIISEEMKALLKPENLNFKMYIVDGEIKTDADELQKSFVDKKVICSFVGTSTEVADKEKFIFTAADASEDVDKKDLPENFDATGIAFTAAGDAKNAKHVGFQMLGCSHLLKNKIDVKLLKKALGKHLATELDLKKTPLVPTQATTADAEKKADALKKIEAAKNYEAKKMASAAQSLAAEKKAAESVVVDTRDWDGNH